MRPIHWLLLALVALILFGAQKLPEFARSLGRSARILKEEMNDLQAAPTETGTAARTTTEGEAATPEATTSPQR